MSGENVKRLPQADRAAQPDAPALGFSLQVDLGAGRVATLQTFLPNDCALEHLDAMLDKMTAAGDRQRAHYQIEELQRDLAIEEKAQAQHEEDLKRLDDQFDLEQEQRATELERLRGVVGDAEKRAAETQLANGRREFKPTARLKADTAAVNSRISQIESEIKSKAAERDVAHANSETTFKRRKEIIEKLRADIAARRAIVQRGSAQKG